MQVAPYDLFEAALRLDGPSLQNLDLLETQEGESKGSLMSVVDTCASAGSKLISIPSIDDLTFPRNRLLNVLPV